eukprot:CAMPEP_0176066348 /NCGR_PEP_ID=MMETSP0120_2-20121206/33109_1 /TAXON_ID=160619 /ORGANISM="Kryptoperidinium foliaceum, Strain CCMP 1326" /LENGTH=513 /DNA_ID=CAMNT_0017399951 /DNA_START=8 /DNA_END=1549 /DNA_ORIENTATION=+
MAPDRDARGDPRGDVAAVATAMASTASGDAPRRATRAAAQPRGRRNSAGGSRKVHPVAARSDASPAGDASAAWARLGAARADVRLALPLLERLGYAQDQVEPIHRDAAADGVQSVLQRLPGDTGARERAALERILLLAHGTSAPGVWAELQQPVEVAGTGSFLPPELQQAAGLAMSWGWDVVRDWCLDFGDEAGKQADVDEVQTFPDDSLVSGFRWRRHCFVVPQLVLAVGLVLISFALGGDGSVGLERFLPGETHLLVQRDCRDQRHEVWRWFLYQYTHTSLLHVALNSVVLFIVGAPLELFHGGLRTAFMFNVGVFGGVCAFFVGDIHRQIVGMSGGCYALQAMHLSDLVLNWRSRKRPWTKLAILLFLIVCEVVSSEVDIKQDGSSASLAVHVGGYVAGLLVGVIVGRNLGPPSCERGLRAVALLLGVAAAAGCVAWGQAWPPRDIWEKTPWCWARQVYNSSHFGDNRWHCIRCGDSDCIARWSMHDHVLTVSAQFCAAEIGWDATDGRA